MLDATAVVTVAVMCGLLDVGVRCMRKWTTFAGQNIM